jgi:tRNA pseudouridine55 synthase
VAWARRVLETDRVGHCGTLDPLATGLLLLVVGDCLKLQNSLVATRKVYRGTFRFGASTDTDDLAGKALPLPAGARDPLSIGEEELRTVFQKYTGAFDQKVPLFSAVKVKGRKLYEWARKGIAVELPVKTVTVHRFDLLGWTAPEASFLVECSKGTYVRSLARDAGEVLKTGGILSSLCREAIGQFSREKAYPWKGEREFREDDLRRAFLTHDHLEKILSAA